MSPAIARDRAALIVIHAGDILMPVPRLRPTILRLRTAWIVGTESRLMTLRQRDRVKEIIDAALDSPPSQRLPNAIEACGSDGVVLAEVERLLACAGEADCLMLTPEFQAVDVLAAM